MSTFDQIVKAAQGKGVVEETTLDKFVTEVSKSQNSVPINSAYSTTPNVVLPASACKQGATSQVKLIGEGITISSTIV